MRASLTQQNKCNKSLVRGQPSARPAASMGELRWTRMHVVLAPPAGCACAACVAGYGRNWVKETFTECPDLFGFVRVVQGALISLLWLAVFSRGVAGRSDTALLSSVAGSRGKSCFKIIDPVYVAAHSSACVDAREHCGFPDRPQVPRRVWQAGSLTPHPPNSTWTPLSPSKRTSGLP